MPASISHEIGSDSSVQSESRVKPGVLFLLIGLMQTVIRLLNVLLVNRSV